MKTFSPGFTSFNRCLISSSGSDFPSLETADARALLFVPPRQIRVLLFQYS